MTSNESNSASTEPGHAESQHIRTSYLAALDEAIGELPHRLATELRAGITEELVGLEGEQLRARIAALGAPADVARAAAEAGHEGQDHRTASPATQLPPVPAAPAQPDPTPRPLTETRGYATAAAVVFGVGGILLPVVGWIIGCALVGTTKLWRTSEKALAIAGPLAVSAILLGVLWVATLPGQSSASAAPGAAANPLLPAGYDLLWSSAFIMFVVVVPLTALWLGLRLRNRPLPTADSRP
ncbi:hypothetical protein FB468_3089 [Leucobacter komagatae]|uniref:Uncharacterized protein n=1 Tax=Leucobacter komagatae TaxID=55969 RepID=A0A542XXL9_9MICO|nr:hypothetical protein [Leucobacter komagatae]TQL40568.1 hypothetical protein FB468_3089 [Leucobacter komagatae]